MKKTIYLLLNFISLSIVFPQTWRSFSNNDEVYNISFSKNMLYGSTAGGVIKYDLINKCKVIEPNNKLTGRYDNVLADKYGNLYLSNISIMKYDGSIVNDLVPSKIMLTKILDSEIDDNQNCLFIELWTGLYIYNGETWKHFDSTTTNFPSIHSTCVSHDRTGNIWVGTPKGLVKFDGLNFSSYTKSNSSIPEETIEDISVDKNNNLWVAAINKIYKYDGMAWQSFSKSDYGSNLTFVSKIAVDSLGNVWIADLINGVSKYDGKVWKYFPSTNSKKVFDLEVAPDNSVWLATNSGLINIIGDKTEIISYANEQLPISKINSFSFDSFGNTWITTDSSIHNYCNGTFKKLNLSDYGVPNKKLYNCSTIDSSGNLWVGYLGGLLKYDGESITQYNWLSSKVPDPNIWCMVTDRKGNVWVGHQGLEGGVFRISDKDWTIYNIQTTGLQIKVVMDICCTDDNTVYIATANDGLFVLKDEKWTNYNTTNSILPANLITSLTLDKNNYVYIGTDKGVVVFDGKTFTKLNSNSEIDFKSIKDINIDRKEKLYAHIAGYGLLEYMGDGIVNQYLPINSGIVYHLLNRIEIDDNNNKWLATNFGFSVFNETSIIDVIPKKFRLVSPANGEVKCKTDLTFKWNAFDPNSKYLLQISPEINFNTIVGQDSISGNTSLTLSGLPEGKEYYWRVKSFRNKISEWSYINNFTTEVKVPTEIKLNRTGLKEIAITWKSIASSSKMFVIQKKQNSHNFITLDTIKNSSNTYTDKSVEQGNIYTYRVKAIVNKTESDFSNEVSLNLVGVDKTTIPTDFYIYQNYPNPFNPSTLISYDVAEKNTVSIRVFDLLGRVVSVLVNEEKLPGRYEVVFDGTKLSSGIYFYRLQADKFVQTRKLVLLK